MTMAIPPSIGSAHTVRFGRRGLKPQEAEEVRAWLKTQAGNDSETLPLVPDLSTIYDPPPSNVFIRFITGPFRFMKRSLERRLDLAEVEKLNKELLFYDVLPSKYVAVHVKSFRSLRKAQKKLKSMQKLKEFTGLLSKSVLTASFSVRGTKDNHGRPYYQAISAVTYHRDPPAPSDDDVVPYQADQPFAEGD